MGPLPVEARQDVEDQREDDAEQDGGPEREVDGGVLAAPGQVAGQTAQRESGPAQQQDDRANGGNEQSEADEKAAEIGHGFSVWQLKSG